MDFSLHAFLFWTIAAMTGLCAIAVVVTQNIVRAATWLLFALAGTSAIFFLLGADLVGAIQLLVYVGGTLVLVVFGVMLTAQGPFISMKTSAAEWAISAVVGILFFTVLAYSLFGVRNQTGFENTGEKAPPKIRDAAYVNSPAVKYAPRKNLSDNPGNAAYSAQIGQTFSGVGLGPAHQDPQANKPIRMNYLLPFEIVSVHLLVVLIGAAYLARAKRRRPAAPPAPPA